MINEAASAKEVMRACSPSLRVTIMVDNQAMTYVLLAVIESLQYFGDFWGIMNEITIFLYGINDSTEGTGNGYLRSRIHESRFVDCLDTTKFKIESNSKSYWAVKENLADRIYDNLSSSFFGNDDLKLAETTVRCARKEVSSLLPLFGGEKIVADDFGVLENPVDEFAPHTPVLQRKTNYATFLILFNNYRIGNDRKSLNKLNDTFSVKTPIMPIVTNRLLDDSLNMVVISLSLIWGVKSGNPVQVASAIRDLNNFLGRQEGPDPMIAHLETLVRNTLDQALADMYNAQLRSILTDLDAHHFARRRERAELTPTEILIQHQELHKQRIRTIDIRNKAGALGNNLIGLPIYLTAQNVLLTIANEMAIYDPHQTDPSKSTHTTIYIPTVIQEAHSHVESTVAEIYPSRKQWISSGRSIHSAAFTVERIVKDDFLNLSTFQDFRNNSNLSNLETSYRQLAAQEEYEELQVRKHQAEWDQLLGLPVQRPSFEIEWVEIDSEDELIFSASTLNHSFYHPNASRIPKGYHLLGSFMANDYYPTPRLIAVKEIDPGVLMEPVRYERVFPIQDNRGNNTGAIWRPIPPAGYVALGHVVINHGSRQPSLSAVRCVREDLTLTTFFSQTGWAKNSKDGGADEVRLFAPWPTSAFSSGCFIARSGASRRPTTEFLSLSRQLKGITYDRAGL